LGMDFEGLSQRRKSREKKNEQSQGARDETSQIRKDSVDQRKFLEDDRPVLRTPRRPRPRRKKRNEAKRKNNRKEENAIGKQLGGSGCCV